MNKRLLQEVSQILAEGKSMQQLAAEAWAEMKKQRKTKIAQVFLMPDHIAVTDGTGSSYAQINGKFTREDAVKLRDELLKLGVPRVTGKVQVFHPRPADVPRLR